MMSKLNKRKSWGWFPFVAVSCLAYPWLDRVGERLVSAYAEIWLRIEQFFHAPIFAWSNSTAVATTGIPVEDLPDGGIFVIFAAALWMRYRTKQRPLALSSVRALLSRPYLEVSGLILLMALWLAFVASCTDTLASFNLFLLHLWLVAWAVYVGFRHLRHVVAARRISVRRKSRVTAQKSLPPLPNPAV
jgi:hypothetical protein